MPDTTANAHNDSDTMVRSWPDISVEECAGYHYISLPDGEVFTGQWDLRGRMPEYIGGIDVKDKRVLDIGCANGFLTFEMEKLGAAEVVSFDADNHSRIAFIPIPEHQYTTNRAAWARGCDDFLTRLKNGYWYCHKRIGSNAACLYGDVYDIQAPDQSFDVTVLSQILVHLRDPITAISEACRLSRDTVVITESTYESNDAAGILHASGSNRVPYIWWLLSVPAYRNMLDLFGFDVQRVHTAKYLCADHEYVNGEIAVTSIVAKRR